MIKFKLATGHDGISKIIPNDSGDYVRVRDAEKMHKLLLNIQVNHCDTAELYNMIDDLLDELNGGE